MTTNPPTETVSDKKNIKILLKLLSLLSWMVISLVMLKATIGLFILGLLSLMANNIISFIEGIIAANENN